MAGSDLEGFKDVHSTYTCIKLAAAAPIRLEIVSPPRAPPYLGMLFRRHRGYLTVSEQIVVESDLEGFKDVWSGLVAVNLAAGADARPEIVSPAGTPLPRDVFSPPWRLPHCKRACRHGE